LLAVTTVRNSYDVDKRRLAGQCVWTCRGSDKKRSTVMRYIQEIIKKNRLLVFTYIFIGICNAFLANAKADYFQKVVE